MRFFCYELCSNLEKKKKGTFSMVYAVYTLIWLTLGLKNVAGKKQKRMLQKKLELIFITMQQATNSGLLNSFNASKNKSQNPKHVEIHLAHF